ncbi:MAG TPA: class I SAM-dependent methyltransferase [Streptosporangiaceae bacterium]|nr:class I SAM-dependent methyltransferase [Streptosporangiaceae bacterium]
MADHSGRPVALLFAGCTTATTDLGVGELRRAGADISLTMIDDDQPVCRAAAAQIPALARSALGDLRTVPLPPRSYDIVQCTRLLERISHAELVLDRLVAALKPGGLLLIQMRDRDSAAGFLDRMLPSWARRMVWRKRHPGRPGPYGAVFDSLASVPGIQAYALMRGLVFAHQQALAGQASDLRAAPRWYPPALRLVTLMSRGRLTNAHEEMRYVLRKPENRFARIV